MEPVEVLINSGNILNKAVSLPKGTDPSTDEELFESLKSCVAQTQENLRDPAEALNGNVLEILSDCASTAPPADRADLKVTSKLFLYSVADKNAIVSAVNAGLKSVSVEYLDNLVLSFSSFSKEGSLTLDQVRETWVILEQLVNDGKVKMIGLADIDVEMFISLHQTVKIKAGLVQINLASCCIVPPALQVFCKDNGIQLLTHKDSIDVLPPEKTSILGKLIGENCFETSTRSCTDWSPNWVLRVQVQLKTRGVLATKAYLGSLSCKIST